MKRIYDESHSYTWSTDPSLATGRSQRTIETPRDCSPAHVTDHVQTYFGDALLIDLCCGARLAVVYNISLPFPPDAAPPGTVGDSTADAPKGS